VNAIFKGQEAYLHQMCSLFGYSTVYSYY